MSKWSLNRLCLKIDWGGCDGGGGGADCSVELFGFSCFVEILELLLCAGAIEGVAAARVVVVVWEEVLIAVPSSNSKINKNKIFLLCYLFAFELRKRRKKKYLKRNLSKKIKRNKARTQQIKINNILIY